MTLFAFLFAMSFWPLTFILALVIFFWISAYRENASIAVLTVIVGTLFGYFIFGVNIWAFVGERPIAALLYAVAYFSVGVIWSGVKWSKWLNQAWLQDKMIGARKAYALQYPDAAETRYVDHALFPDQAKAGHNGDRIVTWIINWPFSVAIYLFGDLLIDLGRWIFSLFSDIYDRMTRHYAP